MPDLTLIAEGVRNLRAYPDFQIGALYLPPRVVRAGCTRMEDTPVQLFRLTDEHWSRIEPLVPPMKWKPGSRGKRPVSDRACMDAIFFILRTGMQWKGLPREYGAPSTVHDRFQYWREKGLFELLWMESLGEFDEEVGIDWDWQSMGGVMVKAPLAGKKTGPNPTDRAKSGTKRSLITEGHGVPVGVVIAAANMNDHKLVEETIDARVFAPPPDLWTWPQHLCLDAGYDTMATRILVAEKGFVAHIRSRRAELESKKRNPRARARRWVVERAHSWMNRYRRLLIRWEKLAGTTSRWRSSRARSSRFRPRGGYPDRP